MRNFNLIVLFLILLLMGCPLTNDDEEVTSPRDNELHENYPANKRAIVVGYLPIYRDNTVDILRRTDLNKLTHIVLAFFNPDDAGNIAYDTSEQNLRDIITYCKANNVKVLISIAGGALAQSVEDFYHNMLLSGNAAERTDFVNKLSLFIDIYNLDGVDVDIEGGVMNDSIYSTGYDDFITKLVSDLRPNNKLVTAALGAWNNSNYPDSALQQLDYLFLMAYDKTGPWTWVNGVKGEHAPQSLVEDLITIYTNKGIANNKLVLGVPFYTYEYNTDDSGNRFTTTYTFNDLIRTYWRTYPTVAFDDISGDAYYNGIDSVSAKTRYAIDNGHAGIMIWEITQDATDDLSKYSLLSAIHRNNY